MIRELDARRPAEEAQYDSLVDSFSDAKRDFVAMYGEPAHKFVTEHLSNPAGKILLDIGCGTGDEATEYERIGFAAVHGIDQSQQMVERTKAAVAHPENFRQGVYEHIPFPDQSLDVVVGNWSIHYVVDLDSAYRELARVLRPGGRLVLAARHPDWRRPDR